MRTISTLEYLSMSKSQQTWYKFCSALLSFPTAIARFFRSIPKKIGDLFSKIGAWFLSITDAFRYGNWKTRMSAIFWGTGCFAYGQVGRGILLSLYEVAFTLYMIFFGGKYLSKLNTLGTVQLVKNDYGVPIGNYDNSFSILLYSMLTIVIIVLTVFLLFKSVRMAYDNQLGYAIAKRSVKMKDGSIGCHCEHTILVTEDGYEILTQD